MTDLDVRPEVLDPETDDGRPKVAHIVKKEDQMRGYVGGESIEALCGKKWVPGYDFTGLPVCEACKQIMERIKNSGEN